MNDSNRYIVGFIAGIMFFLIFPPISLLLGLVAGVGHLQRDVTPSEYYSGHGAAGFMDSSEVISIIFMVLFIMVIFAAFLFAFVSVLL